MCRASVVPAQLPALFFVELRPLQSRGEALRQAAGDQTHLSTRVSTHDTRDELGGGSRNTLSCHDPLPFR